MLKRFITIALILLLYSLGYAAYASSPMPADSLIQDSITKSRLAKKQLRKERVKKRNFHYNILGGPSYTPDYGVLVGGTALMTFRTNPKDLELQRSVLPFTLAILFKGGLNVTTRPQLFFKGDKFRIFGQFLYKNAMENYYGIGFETNKHIRRGKSTTEYRSNSIQINPWFLFRIKESHFFIGPQIDLNYDKISQPARHIVCDEDYRKAGGDIHGYQSFSSGLGIMLSYDTRDVPANAYQGIYFNVQGTIYNKVLGSDTNFYQALIDYRQYKSVGKRKVIAWTVQTKNVFGDVPLNKYALSGTPFDLRGYYMGQYRDKSSHVLMAEYRQMINTDKGNFVKRMLNHVGFTVWAGCGFMGSNPAKIEGILPNYGIGLRIEVQPRMNVRLDIGRNPVNKQNLFYFNMTEAF